MSEIERWCDDVIDRLERYEQATWAVALVPDRVAVARWVIRALADPTDHRAGDVLDQIIRRREQVIAREREKFAQWAAPAGARGREV